MVELSERNKVSALSCEEFLRRFQTSKARNQTLPMRIVETHQLMNMSLCGSTSFTLIWLCKFQRKFALDKQVQIVHACNGGLRHGKQTVSTKLTSIFYYIIDR